MQKITRDTTERLRAQKALEKAHALLEDLGHSIVTARSASEALGILRSEEGDLMMTDHAMPDMTGLELAQAARWLRPEIPIILARGYAEISTEASANVPRRLSKPCTQADLARVLAAAMAASPAAERLAPRSKPT